MLIGFGIIMVVLLLIGGIVWNSVVFFVLFWLVGYICEVMVEFGGLCVCKDLVDNGYLVYFLIWDKFF